MNIIICKLYIQQEFQENQLFSTSVTKMGNHSNNMELKSLHENWVTAAQPTSALYSHINLYRTRLLINTVTLDYIEQYNLYFSCEQQFKQYLHETEWRRGLEHRDPLAYIPPIRAFINTSTVELCTHSYSASIYFDKVEMKLKEINDIPFRDAMYMMRICLEGFKLLMDHFGSFRVTEDMVFINRDGQVKVWINTDLSSIIPNKRNCQQIGNIRQYNSNNPVINLRKNSRQIMRQSTNNFPNTNNINSFGKTTSSPPQTRQNKVSKSSSLSKKNYQQLIHSRNSQNQRDHPHYQNKHHLREINQQNMIKDIIKVVQDNIDMVALQKKIKIMGKNRSKFVMFSQFIKQHSHNQNKNNSFTRNNNSFSTGLNRTHQQIGLNQVPSKPSTNGKNFYRFENILQLYNKYIREFEIKVPRKMEVIFDIFRNRFTERLEEYQMSEINEANDVDGTDCQNDDWGAIDINISDDQKEKTVNKLLKSVNNKQKIGMVNSIDQSNNRAYKQKEKSTPLGMRETKISQEYRMSYGNENEKKNILNNLNMGNNANLKERSNKNVNNLGQLIEHNNFQNDFNNIYHKTNNGGFQQQYTAQNSTQTLQKPSIVSLFNNKAVPASQINININNININNNCLKRSTNYDNNPYSHMNYRGSSLDQKLSAPTKYSNMPKKTNIGTMSRNNISNTSINNTIKSPSLANIQLNPINHQTPLSVLFEQHYHSDGSSQQHRIVRTNHIQRRSNEENITELNKKNIKIGHSRINNMNVNNKYGLQSPKLHSQTTSDSRIFNNIIYLRTPSKLGQKREEPTNNVYVNNFIKPNSVNIPVNSYYDNNNNEIGSMGNLNKDAKIEKYIINANNNYFNKNKQSIENNYLNTDNEKIQKNCRLEIKSNVQNVGKFNNNNIDKNNRIPTYKLNGNSHSLADITQSMPNNSMPNINFRINQPNISETSLNCQRQQKKQSPILMKPKTGKTEKELSNNQTKNLSFVESYVLDSQIADDLQLICPEN